MVMDENALEAFAQELEAKYIPLDSSLIRAIIPDYDCNDPQQLATLKEHLTLLQASAIAEADSAFDPSGTSRNATDSQSPPTSDDRSVDARTVTTTSTSNGTDGTEVSIDLSKLSFGSASHDGQTFIELEGLTTSEKEQRLLEIFPSQDPSSIAYTLKKCQGNFAQATDVLLNHVYFQESTTSKAEDRVNFKGIDGFDTTTSPTMKKRRRKNKTRSDRSSNYDSEASLELEHASMAPARNHWQAASENVDFISKRTNLTPKVVQSIYNKSGGSIKATIRTLIDEDVAQHKSLSANDVSSNADVAMLLSDFSSLTLDDATALIHMARPSTANAHELAKALMRPSENRSSNGGKLIPQYQKVKLEPDDDSDEQISSPASTSNTISSANLANLRSNAFNSASSYYRRAGSDRLFGGAAAYYSQLGRDYNSQVRAASAVEADALVASNSTGDVLDLHGVGVQDALRITASKVDQWWQATRIKEGRSMKERVGSGFTVVTGRGAHSKDGKAKLGPAVFRMLVSKGWKVEVERGLVIVTGKAM